MIFEIECLVLESYFNYCHYDLLRKKKDIQFLAGQRTEDILLGQRTSCWVRGRWVKGHWVKVMGQRNKKVL